MTGVVYTVGAIALGLLFLYSGVRVSLDRSKLRARRVLWASIVYLPLLYGLMVLDPKLVVSRFVRHRFGRATSRLHRSFREASRLRQGSAFHDNRLAGTGLFDSSTLAGKVWLVDFIYTNCPGPCPRMTSQMHGLQKQLVR